MHIPDNYLSPETCIAMTAAMVPVWAVSIKKVKDALPKDKIPKMGVGGSFSFLGMMFNVPLPGGTTGHAVGGTLIALLLGPWAACIAVSMALLLQALIFGDGGILAFGANCFNMAFVLPFVGYAVTPLIAPKFGTEESTKKRDLIAAGVGSYCGLNAAALCAAIEFGIQPMLFTDAAGNALYCPYGLGVAIPAMMIGHLTIFGLVEVIFTCAILAFVRSAAPEMQLSHAASHTSTPLKVFLGALILATPIGLLATGTAWGEWGTDEIADTGIGYTPQGMLDGFQFEAIIPDYSVAGMPEWIGYILSAVIGAACLIILFKLASLLKKGSSAA